MLKPQLEAIIYAAEIPITLDQIIPLVKDSVLSESPEIDASEIRSRVRAAIEELTADYAGPNHGIEIRQVAGGYRMSTKPEQHDAIRSFAKSLKSPSRLSMPALETLAVIAYKQPVTVPEISEIRGVDSGGVIATLLDRKLITTAGRKAVIGRPILYKTSKDFLLRFGLKDIHELPSMEEFEKLLAESFQGDLLQSDAAPAETTEPEESPASETENSSDEHAASNVISIDQRPGRAVGHENSDAADQANRSAEAGAESQEVNEIHSEPAAQAETPASAERK
ncbi:MAG: SMC-Scp complex subunit ScpB [Terriglobales bacterium]